MEFCPDFHSMDGMRLNRSTWERFVASSSANFLTTGLKDSVLPGSQLPPLNLIGVSDADRRIFTAMYDFEQKVIPFIGEDPPDAHLTQKIATYNQLVNQLKRDRNLAGYKSVEDTYKNYKYSDSLGSLQKTILMNGMNTLYLMLCSPDRFLVGLKGGAHWQRISIPFEAHKEQSVRLITLALQYRQNLLSIGNRELEVVPKRYIHLENHLDLRLPKPAKSTGDLMEEAYFGQRYLLPAEGAEVRYRNAGDLTRMIVRQSGSQILARVFTRVGEEFISIDCDTLNTLPPAAHTMGQEHAADDETWTALVAETYRDLVVAEEIPTQTEGSMGERKLTSRKELEEGLVTEPQIIYIPRTIRSKSGVYVRASYDGDPRPVRPHPVIGHYRRANMSDDQRDALRKLEQKWDMKILDAVPSGYTVVRPHFSPEGSEDKIQYFPIFIKRRIETEMRELLSRPPKFKQQNVSG